MDFYILISFQPTFLLQSYPVILLHLSVNKFYVLFLIILSHHIIIIIIIIIVVVVVVVKSAFLLCTIRAKVKGGEVAARKGRRKEVTSYKKQNCI
jgi:hypothetical protein